MKLQRIKAFTLVELIVVITILAILGTIGFISLQGYSASARDSKRISDIQNIKKSLELFALNTGKYPYPDNSNDATFSGNTVWKQGIIGDNVFKNLSRNLNKKPLDPSTESEYIYSVTNVQKEYELMSIYESDILSYNLLNQSRANNQNYTKIDGTYNGVAVKTPNYIIPTPSIINSEIKTSDLELDQNTIKSQLITSGENYLNTGGIKENKIRNLNLNFNYYEIEPNGYINYEDLGLLIQNTYSGTVLANDGGKIQKILLITDSNELKVVVEQSLLSKKIQSLSNDNPVQIINGICGTDNGKNVYSTPTNICSSGTGSIITFDSGNNLYSWNCKGLGGGTNESCSSTKVQNPFTFDSVTQTITGYDKTIGGTTPVIPETIGGVEVLHIGNSAFSNKQLTAVTLPNTLKTIGDTAFYMNQLWTVKIPNGVTSIGTAAFRQNYITSLSLPNSITNISSLAFAYQSAGGVGKVYGPASGYVFDRYLNDTGTQYFDKVDMQTYIYTCSIDTCASSAYSFDEITGTITGYDKTIGGTTPVIPSSINGITVNAIGYGAFSNKQLTAITLPNTLKTIADMAFYMNQLWTVKIPNGVTSIGSAAFRQNYITSLSLPSSITNISSLAFAYQSAGGVGKVYGPASGYVYDRYLNDTGTQYFDKVDMQTYIYTCSIDTCASSAYSFDEITGTITGYDKTIGGTTPVIPSSINGITVNVIGYGAFSSKQLTAVTLPSTLKTISDMAFYFNSLQTIVIPNGVTNIGSGAFRRNYLRYITIPSSVISILSYAFWEQSYGANSGTLYGPASGYVLDTYNSNLNSEFDKTDITTYTGNQP